MDIDIDLDNEEEELIKVRDNVSHGIPLPMELMYREMGFNSFPKRRKCVIGKKLVSDNLQATADYNLVACNKKLLTKSVSERGTYLVGKVFILIFWGVSFLQKFKLPSGARTTFHMAFSGDGKLVA